MKRFGTVPYSTNPHRFVVCLRISTLESCSEARLETFKPRFFHFWVGLFDLGLGFVSGTRENEEYEVRRERTACRK